jgi:putative addiction module component (TIGR02574 family)
LLGWEVESRGTVWKRSTTPEPDARLCPVGSRNSRSAAQREAIVDGLPRLSGQRRVPEVARRAGIGEPTPVSVLSPERIRELTPAERIELIELLWESFLDDPDSLPVTEEQRAELRRRLAEHERDPDAAKPWAEVRAELERE